MKVSAENVLNRFLSASFLQIFRAALVFLISVILARHFGPESFGNYAFLTTAFIQVWSLTDSGFQNSFYTNLSSSRQNKNFYLYSLYILLFQLTFSSLMILVFFSTNLLNFLFLDNQRDIIFWAFLSIISQKSFLNNATYIAESIRKNFLGNIFEFLAIIFQITAISILILTDLGSLKNIFIAVTISNLLSCIFSISFIKREYLYTDIVFKNFYNKVIIYMKPLIFFSWFSFMIQFFDVWILSKVSGYVEQSYFQVGHRFSLIFIVFMVSLTNINWKETASFISINDYHGMYKFIFNITRYVTCASIVFSMFLFFSSQNLITLFFGEDFISTSSILTFKLLMINIIFHTIGGISTSSYYGSKRAITIVKFQSVALIIGLILSVIFISDSASFYFGFNLGAKGLALKILLISIVFHLASFLYFFKNSQFRALSLLQPLIRQFISVSFIGFILNHVVNLFFTNIFISLLVYFIFYSVTILIVLFRFPYLLAIKNEEISFFIDYIKEFLFKKNTKKYN